MGADQPRRNSLGLLADFGGRGEGRRGNHRSHLQY